MGERPVLIVAGEEDRRMSVALQERVFEASVSEASRFRSFPDARHGAAYRMHADAYEGYVDGVRRGRFYAQESRASGSLGCR